MANIEIQRLSVDRLSGESWSFSVSGGVGGDTVELRLSSYAQISRATTRHKWVTDAIWDMSRSRWSARSLKHEEVNLPDDVWQDAADCISITVIGPKGWKPTYEHPKDKLPHVTVKASPW